ncbi:MAG: c-type cytochrome [Methylophilaceae bacterium]|jgi:cytochrome c5|tara:strand:- start:402 stop:884 length:483 start_codon:yes stop_codon:yes gene_type:complete
MSKQSELRSLLETVFVVIGTLVGAIIIITFATTKSDTEDTTVKVVENKPVEENVQPVAEVKVAENNTATDNNSEENSLISGEKISQVNCILCHGAGVMGAPKIGDAAQWEARIAQGKDKLIDHAIKGINMMPAKGGNAALSDEEVAAAVIWMANQSGGSL